LLFFLDWSSDVLLVNHSPEQLGFITDEDSTIYGNLLQTRL